MMDSGDFFGDDQVTVGAFDEVGNPVVNIETSAVAGSGDWTVYEPYQDPNNPNAPVEMIPVDPYEVLYGDPTQMVPVDPNAAPVEMIPVDPYAPTQDPTQAPVQDPVVEAPADPALTPEVQTQAPILEEPLMGDTIDMPQLGEIDPSSTSVLVGDPYGDQEFWHRQQTNYTCAVVSQEFMVEQLTGQSLSEGPLADWAAQNGFLTTAGTYPAHMAEVLKAYGLQSETTYGNNIDTLYNELAEGNKVMVAVDKEEIWYQGKDYNLDEGDEATPNTGSDHAVQVTGIIETPQGTMVVLNDPGVDQGQGSLVPLEEFADAWQDSSNLMISAGPPIAQAG